MILKTILSLCGQVKKAIFGFSKLVFEMSFSSHIGKQKEEKSTFSAYLLVVLMVAIFACYPSEELNIEENENDKLYTELDDYINDNFVDKFNMAVRYKYQDNFVGVGQRTVPVELETVRPMLDFLEEYWIGPFLVVENGEEFFKLHVPAEVVLLGGLIYDGGGVTLGFAEAGSRITLLNVNGLDFDDADWIQQQLNIIYHEFAHVVHQRYGFPTGFEDITPTGYTGPGSWFTLTDEDALERGFVTPYSTQEVGEDFAETVAFYLFDVDFESKFLTLEENCAEVACETRNEGREKIKAKLASVSDHYEKVTGINLAKLREATQSVIVK
ncbi:MAG: substrate import-associated zinc metallohydrolase lipoprotein [Cyclobacteriaceae bacterium]|jgi:substrate import-associated zinc metallohydrolase lipoprotein